MNNLFKNIFSLLFVSLLIVNCNNDDDNHTTPTSSTKDFVWKGMNSWYNWQESVPELADETADNLESYNNYLDGFDSPQELFQSLLHVDDDFSWFIDDYVEQQQAFQGISTSFGFRPSLVRVGETDFVIMYIQQVSNNSPAAIAGFQRGDIINGINGTVMTLDNYQTVLEGYNDTTATFSFTENDGLTIIESKTITQTTIEDNPVHLTKIFNDIAGKKVGYLVYNSFRSSYNDELNDAFGELQSAGINELILDLRYNGGGSALTSAFLASMIYADADDNTTFGEIRYNSKHTGNDFTLPFFDELFVYNDEGEYTGEDQTINRLQGINKLYILTSSGTASASEMIINGLRPFIEVKLIGDTTTGKNEGSVTLYDSSSSDFRDEETANTSHTLALQPIVSQVFNSLGESDYTFGFTPDIEVLEWNYWDNILPFGDENEILLKTALDDIRGVASKSSFSVTPSQKIEKNLSTNKFEQIINLDSHYFK